MRLSILSDPLDGFPSNVLAEEIFNSLIEHMYVDVSKNIFEMRCDGKGSWNRGNAKDDCIN